MLLAQSAALAGMAWSTTYVIQAVTAATLAEAVVVAAAAVRGRQRMEATVHLAVLVVLAVQLKAEMAVQEVAAATVPMAVLLAAQAAAVAFQAMAEPAHAASCA